LTERLQATLLTVRAGGVAKTIQPQNQTRRTEPATVRPRVGMLIQSCARVSRVKKIHLPRARCTTRMIRSDRLERGLDTRTHSVKLTTSSTSSPAKKVPRLRSHRLLALSTPDTSNSTSGSKISLRQQPKHLRTAKETSNLEGSVRPLQKKARRI